MTCSDEDQVTAHGTNGSQSEERSSASKWNVITGTGIRVVVLPPGASFEEWSELREEVEFLENARRKTNSKISG